MRKTAHGALWVWALCAMILSSGCATQQFMPVPDLTKPDSTKARIKVHRPFTIVGGGKSIPISDNGERVGNIGGGGQMVWERPPGIIELAAWIPTGLSDPIGRRPPIYANVAKVTLEAGKEYSYEVCFSFFAVGQIAITPVSPVAIATPITTLRALDRCGPYPENYREIAEKELTPFFSKWLPLRQYGPLQWSLSPPTKKPVLSDLANMNHLCWLVTAMAVGRGDGITIRADVRFMLYNGIVFDTSCLGIEKSNDEVTWENISINDRRLFSAPNY